MTYDEVVRRRRPPSAQLQWPPDLGTRAWLSDVWSSSPTARTRPTRAAGEDPHAGLRARIESALDVDKAAPNKYKQQTRRGAALKRYHP